MIFFKSKNLKNNKEQIKVPVQTASSNLNLHPFYELNNRAYLRKHEAKFYRTLREAVPIIDAAINKTVRLIGNFKIKCSNEGIEKDLNRFLNNVKVNFSSSGIESFISLYFDQLLTDGTAVGEVVINPENNSIYALYNASLKNVELELGENPLELNILKKDKYGNKTSVNNKNLILVSTLNAEPGSAYGKSVLKGLPFVSNILLNIYNTIGLNWERVGNIRFAVTYKPGANSSEKIYTKERVTQIASEWSKAMHSKGSVNDFISVGDVDIKVIGADNQVLDSQVPVRQMLEQIVAKLSIPPFLLGLSWSTTERMSAQQADILTSELEFYRRVLNRVILKICNIYLELNGISEDVLIEWENINLQDEVELANARFTLAKAMEIEKRIGVVN